MIEQPSVIKGMYAAKLNQTDKPISVEELTKSAESISMQHSSNGTPMSDIAEETSITQALLTGVIQEMSVDALIELIVHPVGVESRQLCDYLLVDLRPPNFRWSIKTSINPCFPPLVMKRFKKKMFSNFNLSGFLSLPVNQARWNSWREGSGPKYVVVYDETMGQKNSDAWSFAMALTSGLGNDFMGIKTNPKVIVLVSGFNGVFELPNCKDYLVSTDNDDVEVDTADKLALVNDQFSASPVSEGHTLIPTNAVAQRGATTKSKSLSINVFVDKKRTTKKGPNSLNLVIGSKAPLPPSHEADQAESNPLSSASPNDNAAPPEPFSRVTKNIMVGSDQLPLASDGVTLLSNIGVTHILNMAAEIKNSDIVVNSGRFSVKWIPVLDNTEVDMDEALLEAICYIGN